MSESTFPFGGQEPAPFEAEETERRKPVVLVGAMAGALLLGAGGFFLLGGGGESVDQFAAPVSRAPRAQQPVAAAPEALVVPAAAEEPVGRNPFKVLYVAPKAATAGTTTEGAPAGTGTGTTSGTTSGGTSGGTSGTSTGGTKPGGTSTGGTPTTPGQPEQPPKYLTVVAVNSAENQVTFQLVDRAASKPEDVKQSVVVKPGEVFATYFKLLGYGTLLDANNAPRNCTDLQYGDARIKLCENESYQVGR